MSLDELISKYLDSDLTYEEDKLLRGYVTSDAESKEKFDTSVTLHYTMREDAESIRTPQDIMKETEDKILMMILNEPPVIMPTIRRIRRIPTMSLMAAALFILFVIQINEPVINNRKQNPVAASQMTTDNRQLPIVETLSASSGEVPVQKNLNAGKLPGIGLTDGSSSTGTTSSEEVSLVSGISYSSVDGQKTRDFIEDFKLYFNDMLPNETISELIGGITSEISRSTSIKSDLILPDGSEIIVLNNATLAGNEPTIDVSNENDENRNLSLMKSTDKYKMSLSPSTTILNPGNVGSLPMLNAFDDIKSSSEVQLTTFFGTDFFRGGLNLSRDQPVSHLAQSIGYALDENSSVGIEVGYTQYVYNDNFDIKVPIGKSLNSDIPGSRSNVEVKDVNPGEYDYISYSMVVERTKQMFWGAVFYEMSFYSNYGLSLNSRAGIGSSGEGMLGYGRIFGKYEVLPGFYTTIGLDARLFYTTLQMLSRNSAGVKSSASLIYGLQIKF